MIHRLPAGTLRRDVVALLKTKAVKCVAVIDGRAANKDEVDEIPQGAKKWSVSTHAHTPSTRTCLCGYQAPACKSDIPIPIAYADRSICLGDREKTHAFYIIKE